MLNKFDTIVTANKSADSNDWKMLVTWLQKKEFPNISFQDGYTRLMSESNGGVYTNGEREYQFLSLREVAEYYEAYMFSKYMPFAFPFAMDGCGNFYIFNQKEQDDCVYCVGSGNLGWAQDECFRIANDFWECISQKNKIEEYLY